MAPAFPYRLSVVDDDPALWEVAYARVSLTDLIISDLRMPNMNGSEFLSVVRRRFSTIPLIVISGEFTGLNVPESVLADACFPKGQYRPQDLFAKIEDFLCELPSRPKVGKPHKGRLQLRAVALRQEDVV